LDSATLVANVKKWRRPTNVLPDSTFGAIADRNTKKNVNRCVSDSFGFDIAVVAYDTSRPA